VSFLPAFLRWLPIGWGNYWVIGLAPDYRYAVVGEPSREYLWILSRTPALAEQDRKTIDELLRTQGYDPAKLVATPQGAH
jgi:apolipoprotein D and lipocalin family protein